MTTLNAIKAAMACDYVFDKPGQVSRERKDDQKWLVEQLEAAEKWLKEKARHTMHCGWKDGMYDVKRGCTCGLAILAGETPGNAG